MSAPAHRGRFAPSPTGDLHLGGARTALVAWLAARAAGAAFVLRVEDLDRPRVAAGAEARILADLAWLGLDWDEGPDRGGPFAPYRQSDALERFQSAIQTLLRQGRAFPCFCSRAEVARAARAPHGPGDDGPRYPGTCRALTPDEVAARSATRRPAARLRVAPGVVGFADGVHGPRQEDVSHTVGDFIIGRADGVPAYQLAVVVDDAAMRIGDVVRGDDLLGSTARQILLYRALDLVPPAFAHVPLVLGPDGARLSKRHGAIGVRGLPDPRRVVGFLAHTLGLVDDPDAHLDPRELIAGFDLARVRKTAAIVDPTRFR
jgi:glutamyl-tRNA synthetase